MSQRSQIRLDQARRLARKLAAYVAAGVVADGTSRCDASIVYHDLEPPTSLFGELDLNADGQIDFEFRAESGHDTWGCDFTTSGYLYCHTWAGSRKWFTIEGQGREANLLLGADWFGNPLAHALAAGESITSSAAALGHAILVQSSSTASGGSDGCDPGCSGSLGEFLSAGRAYLGVVFVDGEANLHTGWIGIESADDFLNLSMFGYAYETVPGNSIAAGAVPEPPSLVLLAAGAAGLAALRRKRATNEQS